MLFINIFIIRLFINIYPFCALFLSLTMAVSRAPYTLLVELENCALETCLEDIEVRVTTKSGKKLTVQRIRELFEPNSGELLC